MGQQLIDPMVRMREQSLKDIPQVDPGVMPMQPGRLHQAHHHGGTLSRALAAGK